MINLNQAIASLKSITLAKVNKAIEDGKQVIIEERHVDTRCKTHYHRLAEIDGTIYQMSAAGFNKVQKQNKGQWFADCTNYGGYEGYVFN